jgi:hypothetical protein
VLASEQLKRRIGNFHEPNRDTVVLLTGIPGAGKTSSVLEAGELPDNIRAVYEGQLANRETALSKVQQVLDAGLKPVILAVHTLPEKALENTLRRFDHLGRGASVGLMASIQSGLPEALDAVRERFGNAVQLQIVDRRIFDEPRELEGWEHLPILRSEGNHEHIRRRLDQALEKHLDAGRISEDAYRQALGKTPRSQNQALDSPLGGRNEGTFEERGRAAEDQQEAFLRPSAAERLRLRSDQVAERLAKEREHEKASQQAFENQKAQGHEHGEVKKAQANQSQLDQDQSAGLEP